MQPFTILTATALPLLRDNVDTDSIIPSREIKSVSKSGLAGALFAGWRYRAAGGREPDPRFVLNDPAYSGAQILISGANFGCGSSREHAVWALAEYGFRAILAEGFAPIFFDNCVNNGLLAARLPAADLRMIATALAAAAPHTAVTIDLQKCTIAASAFDAVTFDIDPDARTRLLDGLDAIDLTLRGIAAIDGFRARDRSLRPWVYLAEMS
jgi:3-isopropylmalate/(R)-2-methylmalate dehydratase small subunit